MCLCGLGLMVWADFTSRSQGPKPGRNVVKVFVVTCVQSFV
jgi:hypothetical protein